MVTLSVCHEVAIISPKYLQIESSRSFDIYIYIYIYIYEERKKKIWGEGIGLRTKPGASHEADQGLRWTEKIRSTQMKP